MIISYEKHLNDFVNREQSLQKIIKSQEESLSDLRQKLSEKTEHLVLPLKMRYESELSLKNREILDLQNRFSEIQLEYNEEKSNFSLKFETNVKTSQNLQKQLEFEKETFSQKLKEIDNSLKAQIMIISSENESILEENKRLRGNLILIENKSELELLIDEFNSLQGLFKEKEADLLAENLYYKNEIDVIRKNSHEQMLLNQKEKKVLQKKIDEMLIQIKSNENDMKYEIEQFKEHLKELNRDSSKKNSEVYEIKANKEKIINELLKEKEDLEHTLSSQREEFLSDLKKKEEAFEKKFELLSKEMLIINEEKSNELEKFIREIEILKNEKLVYEKNLEEAKNSLIYRETGINSELIRQKLALDKLIELGQQRENLLQEDIMNLHEAMINLQKSYENKENLMYDGDNEKRRSIDILERISEGVRKIEEKVYQAKNYDSHKLNDLAKENKQSLQLLSERQKDLEKLKNEQFLKKLKEKDPIIHQYDRLMTSLIDLNNQIPLITSILNQNNNDFFPIHQNLEKTPQKEVEILKYEEKLIKNEAELDLAKKSLLMYINHVKELEEQLEMMSNETERGFKEQEIIDLKLENTKLKEENRYLYELNEKLDEKIFKKFQVSAKELNDSTHILTNNSKQVNNSTEKKVPKSIVGKGDLKRTLNQMLENLQIISKNLNSPGNFSVFEGEVIKGLKDSLKLYENRISQYEKVFENDLAVIGKKLQFIEEIIGDPLGLTQKSFGEMSEFCELLRNEVNSYQSKNTFNQNIWKEFESKLRRSPFLQEGEKNLLYQNEQQTITILRSETNSLYNIIEQERENHKKELSTLTKNFEVTQQIFEEKTDSIRIELDNQNKLNEELKNCLQNVKTQQNKEVKKLRFELNNVNKFITEKQMRFNEDKKRLNAEIVRLEGIISQKDISNKKIYENKLIKFVESIEEKNRIINAKNVQTIQEEAFSRKIEEEKERKYNIEITALKEELNNLREMEKEREDLTQREKDTIIKINEGLQQGFEKLNNDKQIYLNQIHSLNEMLVNKEKLMKEKEKQFNVEVYQRSHH